MAERGAAHEALRSGTRAEHEALDALFAGFDLGDPDAYRCFLIAHAAALPPVEAALDAVGFDDALADWPDRRRAGAIASDLAAMDTPMPAPLPFPPLTGISACWGAAYVLEGSRLGGAFLARQVGDGLPRSYLGTAQPAGRWKTFLTAMDAALAGPQEIDAARETADAVFALFAAAGRRQLEKS